MSTIQWSGLACFALALGCTQVDADAKFRSREADPLLTPASVVRGIAQSKAEAEIRKASKRADSEPVFWRNPTTTSSPLLSSGSSAEATWTGIPPFYADVEGLRYSVSYYSCTRRPGQRDYEVQCGGLRISSVDRSKSWNQATSDALDRVQHFVLPCAGPVERTALGEAMQIVRWEDDANYERTDRVRYGLSGCGGTAVVDLICVSDRTGGVRCQ